METITGHVKLVGRANKNNYRAIARLPPKRVVRIIYGLQLRCSALYYPPSSPPPPPCGESGKKGVEKGGGGKNEGKERRVVGWGANYYLVPADTPVASRNRDLTFVEMSMALFYFSFSTPLLSKDDTQLSPLFRAPPFQIVSRRLIEGTDRSSAFRVFANNPLDPLIRKLDRFRKSLLSKSLTRPINFATSRGPVSLCGNIVFGIRILASRMLP